MSQSAVPGPSAARASLGQNCPTEAVSTSERIGFARKMPNVGTCEGAARLGLRTEGRAARAEGAWAEILFRTGRTMNCRSSIVLGTRRMPNVPISSCEIEALLPSRSSDTLLDRSRSDGMSDMMSELSCRVGAPGSEPCGMLGAPDEAQPPRRERPAARGQGAFWPGKCSPCTAGTHASKTHATSAPAHLEVCAMKEYRSAQQKPGSSVCSGVLRYRRENLAPRPVPAPVCRSGGVCLPRKCLAENHFVSLR